MASVATVDSESSKGDAAVLTNLEQCVRVENRERYGEGCLEKELPVVRSRLTSSATARPAVFSHVRAWAGRVCARTAALSASSSSSGSLASASRLAMTELPLRSHLRFSVSTAQRPRLRRATRENERGQSCQVLGPKNLTLRTPSSRAAHPSDAGRAQTRSLRLLSGAAARRSLAFGRLSAGPERQGGLGIED